MFFNPFGSFYLKQKQLKQNTGFCGYKSTQFKKETDLKKKNPFIKLFRYA